MNWTVSKRLDGIGEYYFSTKLREVDELNKAGKQIINLGIGSPDLPPHPDVVKTLQEEASKDNQHAYQSYKGVPVLREAIAAWYQKYFKVEDINPATEILPLLGSKEGIMHICMTYLNEGDQVLIPNPGYPTYTSAVKLAGGTPLYYELTAENSWAPDFENLEKSDLSKVKLMWVNYPHMPTGQSPTKALFEQLVAFGKKHQILICHDNPYAFILNDKPESLLSIDGAKEVVIELNSLSKTFNMSGWRIGMVLGSKQNISNILKVKSNMDSGMFYPIQKGAIAVLNSTNTWFDQINKIYNERRILVWKLADSLNCRYDRLSSGLFVWAKIQESIKSKEFTDALLYNHNIFIAPGDIFGSNGEGYVRFSLCAPKELLIKAINRINE